MIALEESRRWRVLPLHRYPVRRRESVREAMLRVEMMKQEFSSSSRMRRSVVREVVLFVVTERYTPVCCPSQMV